MELSPSTKISALLDTYPFLLDFLAGYNPKFKLLKNRAMRATMGHMATLNMAADIGGVDVDELIRTLKTEIEKHEANDIPVGTATVPLSAKDKVATLKELIMDLHKGVEFSEVKQRFDEAIQGVEASEIAAMEEQLIREGMPAEEIQRLCDLHVSVFETALEQKGTVEAPSGHPVNSYMEENTAFQDIIRQLDAVVSRLAEQHSVDMDSGDAEKLGQILEKLSGLETHYVRKENQLFPFLERHDITGPSKVMWGIHDEIRAMLKEVKSAVEDRAADRIVDSAPKLSRAVIEMIYKENTILFPMAMETFSEDEWREIRKGEDDIGYVFIMPGTDWPEEAAESAGPAVSADREHLTLDTGALSLTQLNLLLKHLPVEVSFVDENDELRYYSDTTERIFPRSPGVIGRKVQNCHPPKSVHIVEKILDAFKSGKKDSAAFWIDLGGRKIHISYYAVRDNGGSYRGTVEVTQDITDIIAIGGEQRLLDWDA